jgi:predicted RNA-binding protein with RPS1 domain
MAPPAGFAPRKALAVKNVETSDVSSRAPFVSAATVKRRLSLKAKEKEKEKPARRPAKQEKTQQRTGVSKPSEKAPRDSAMEPRRFGSEAPRGGSEQPSPRDEDRLAGEIV